MEVPHRELGCASPPWEELEALSALAREYNCPLHMDGARLLEIAPYYGRTAAEVAALFDTVYVSFYKGLGAMTGAMLLGDAAFIAATKPWRRRLGGNPYTVLPYALSCATAFRAHAGSFDARYRKMAAVAARLSADFGGRLRFVPEAPQCCQAHCYLRGDAAALDAARDAVEARLGYRVYERLRGAAVGGGDECYFVRALRLFAAPLARVAGDRERRASERERACAPLPHLSRVDAGAGTRRPGRRRVGAGVGGLLRGGRGGGGDQGMRPVTWRALGGPRVQASALTSGCRRRVAG
eukprot:3789146-Prymnesium_polylepis.1